MDQVPSDARTQITRLEKAIAALEGQRAMLGDATVDAALVPLHQQIAVISAQSDLRVVSPEQPQPRREERRIITILFSDVVGSVGLAEKLDPEDWKRTIAAVQSTIGQLVSRQQGMIAQYQGDGLIAFFGAREANECDAENAVLAGLAAQAAVAQLDLGMPLQIRVGIHTGLVVLGEWGADAKIEFGAFGDAVNVAARLQSTAAPGTVLISNDTYRQVRGIFEFESLPPVQLKGKSKPMLVHRVAGVKARPARARGLEQQGLSSPLVGRDAEVAALRGCVERLMDRQGGIVSIIGEAGVGKSRLMAEIRKSVPAERLRWLEGRALSFGQTISYWPFREILHAYAGITEEDSEAERWQKLERAVTELFAGETPEVLPYLASLLTLEVKGEYIERVKYLDGEAMGHQLFLVARRFFERLAQAMPVVLVFEDLHWSDESSALLLEHLLPLVEQVPLLLCGVSRPDPATPAARLREVAVKDYAHCYTEIRLTPLSEGDSATLIRNLLAIENLSPRVHDLIVRKAEGNPFFLEEIIRSLIDAGAVVRDPASGRWRATAQVETLTIPDTVQGVITARIDRLDEDLRQILKTAAVIGRSFLYRVLCAIAAADRELDLHLTELQAVEFIREKQRLPELEYIFKHALVQETTYESILLQRRRELHVQVARVIETLFAERLDDFYSLLAYHYARAEAWEKAQEYLLKSADQAGHLAADAEALAHYQQAMDVYNRMFGDKWDPFKRASLEGKMGEALYRRGEHQQALVYLERALSYLGSPLPKSTWAVRLAILGEAGKQLSHVLLPGRFVKSDSGQISPRFEEQIRLSEVVAWIDLFTNPERLLFLSLKCLNASESNGFLYGVSTGFASLAVIWDFIQVYSLAEFYHKRAIAAGEKIHDPAAMAMSRVSFASHYSFLGKLDEAMSFAEQAAATSHEIGDLHDWGMSVYWMFVTHIYRGNLSLALDVSRNLLQVARGGADRQMECWGMALQGFVEQRLGHLDEAIVALKQAAEFARALPDTAFTISANADLGRCYLRQGDLTAALAALEASQKAFVPSLGGDSYASLRNGRPEAFLLAAERSVGFDRAAWLKKAVRACREALKQEKEFRPGLPEAMRLQGTCEWLKGNRASADKWWQRSLAEAERMKLRYDIGMTLAEMGKRLGDRANLDRAEAIFSEIGAEWDLARAQEALKQMRQSNV